MKQKTLIVLICCLLATTTLSAQEKKTKLVRYSGMVDIAAGISASDGGSEFTGMLTTTHGVTISPYFFTGVGVGVSTLGFPVYLRMRGNLYRPQWRVCPFIETDLGAELRAPFGAFMYTGFTYSLAVGGKIPWRRGGKGGIAITLGYRGMTPVGTSGGDPIYQGLLKVSFDF